MAQSETAYSMSNLENIRIISVGKYSPNSSYTYTHEGAKNITHFLVLVTDGEGDLVVDTQKFKLQKNSLFLIHAESECTLSCGDENPFSFLSVIFECSHVESLITLSRKNPVTLLHDSKTERRMNALYRCLEVQTKRSILRATSYFYAVLSSIAESRVIAKPEKSKNVIKDAIEYINSNYMNNEMTITSIAEKFYLNRSYFSELFKKETGVTAVNYISEIRLQKGVELLTKTDMSISQISDEIGMNFVWFSKLFKSRYKTSPSQFRAEIRKDK